MYPYDLDFWPTFTKLGHVTRTTSRRYEPILKFIALCIFDIFDHKMHISAPCWLETSVAMATFLCPTCDVMKSPDNVESYRKRFVHAVPEQRAVVLSWRRFHTPE